MRTRGALVRAARSSRTLALAPATPCNRSPLPRGAGIDLNGALADQTKPPPVDNHRACYARLAEEATPSRTQDGGFGSSWYIRLSSLASAWNQSRNQSL